MARFVSSLTQFVDQLVYEFVADDEDRLIVTLNTGLSILIERLRDVVTFKLKKPGPPSFLPSYPRTATVYSRKAFREKITRRMRQRRDELAMYIDVLFVPEDHRRHIVAIDGTIHHTPLNLSMSESNSMTASFRSANTASSSTNNRRKNTASSARNRRNQLFR
jgi:hypothetical protein